MMTSVRPSLSRSAALAALVLLGVGASAHAQNIFDDFSSGNDNAWTRIDAPNLFLGIPSTYSVANGQYTITTPTQPNLGFLFPTASARSDSVGVNSQVSVDIPAFTDRPVISVNARGFQSPSGSFNYYSLSFFPLSNAVGPNGEPRSNLRIDRWNADPSNPGSSIGNIVTAFDANAFARVNTANTFRMVFTLEGATLTGQVFDLTANSGVPLQTISAEDTSPLALLGAGASSLSIYSNQVSQPSIPGASATFDNFRVVPAPGAAAMLGLAGLFAARRRR